LPSVDENRVNWSSNWDWSQRGDEWSAWWGGTDALWHGVLLPRIHSMLPAGQVLEIAPGYGRWTQYLKDVCDQLVIVDLTPGCIEHCRERFATSTNISYHINDGRSLAMIDDGSTDFIFSFDSLVHATADVMEAYVEQLASKLSPEGIGFIHHSNAGSLGLASRLAHRAPKEWYMPLMRRGLVMNLPAWRDASMSASIFRAQCERVGLACIGQELISWEYGLYMIDCLSMFARKGSSWDRPTRVVRNPLFVTEARRMARLYARSSFTSRHA
jgi:2-polyprenyl-3-methyl-5-hydroxy-6-metoxy-1,4-benzoquinol methylase